MPEEAAALLDLFIKKPCSSPTDSKPDSALDSIYIPPRLRDLGLTIQRPCRKDNQIAPPLKLTYEVP
ncbi:5-oxoprolinase [Moniliophthora roreri]|nr:5-oxoprolinase [Moniliophthora roreri]